MAVSTIDPNGLNIGQIGGTRNKIINGAMTIDQRNAGAAVTVNANAFFFPVDRFPGFGQSADGVFTLQRSATAPNGFTNSVIATVTTDDASIGATQEYGIAQNIEGFNVADLGWGAAGASAVTLSFWVRSSVTGTHSGSLSNNAYNRAYAFSYTISVADTFEYKTITIPGDTTGTWLKDSGTGIRLRWNLGTGSTYLGTAGAWGSSFLNGATGSVQLISTNGATFYLTGVQLEAGDTATPFEHRSFGAELALCQRYFEKSYDLGTVAGAANENGMAITWAASVTNYYSFSTKFLVSKRATPTVTLYNPESGTTSEMRNTDSGGYVTVAGIGQVGQTAPFVFLYSSSAASAGGNRYSIQWTASAEL
jgi:hypothetical protein